MAVFRHHQLSPIQSVALPKDELVTVPWFRAEEDGTYSLRANILEKGSSYQCTANVHVSGEGRYLLYFGKVDERAINWSEEPETYLVAQTSDEERSQIMIFDRNYGNTTLRLWVKALDQDMELVDATCTSWEKSSSSSSESSSSNEDDNDDDDDSLEATVNHNRSTEDIQSLINEAGYSPELVVDGIHGPKTAAGVEWYQGVIGTTQDGIWGPLTEQAHVDHVNDN